MSEATFTHQLERMFLKRSIVKNSLYLTGRCLDVGSEGTRGRYYGVLKNISDYTSLDIFPELEPDIVANAEEIPVHNESFDSIVCTQALQNVPHPDKAIKEFKRILRVHGHVIISMPMIGLYRGTHDLWRYTPAGLRLLLEENGFEIIVIESIGVGIFSVTHQFFNRYIKARFNIRQKNISRGVFNKMSIIFGHVFTWIDSKLGENNSKYIMNVVAVARKK